MKFISKDAVLAEIERRIKTNKECMLGLRNLNYYQGKVDALKDTLSYLDTLKVKEVDMEKEIEDEIDKYWFDNSYGCIQRSNGTAHMELDDVKEIAKHFFELGVNASNPLTWEDIKLIYNITYEESRNVSLNKGGEISEQEFYQEVLKRFKEKKGEKLCG